MKISLLASLVILLFAAMVTSGCSSFEKQQIEACTPLLKSGEPYKVIEAMDKLINLGAEGESAIYKSFREDGNYDRQIHLLISCWYNIHLDLGETDYNANYNLIGGRLIWVEHSNLSLHHAAEACYAFAAKILLIRGADPNLKDKEGKTALDYATFHERKELIPLLRSHGAKTAEELREEAKKKEPSYKYILNLKSDDLNKRVAAVNGLLMMGGAGIKALSEYLSGGTKAAEFLAKNWANLNKLDPLGFMHGEKHIYGYPIHITVSLGYKDVTSLFIDRGVDVNLNRDWYKFDVKADSKWQTFTTPLDLAIMYKYKEIEELLRVNGAKTGIELKMESEKK